MATQKPPPENNEDPKSVRGKIESKQFQLAVASVLPAHLTPERFTRISILALTRVPKLAECDPNTILACLMTLSQFGLEPDGRHAHLIPFWNSKRNVNECQLIIDYKGLVALAKRSGNVSYVHADKVCENDVFKYNKGVVEEHSIDFKKDRGPAYAYYAIVRYKDGTEQAAAMTKDEVNSIRSRSKAKDHGPWVTDYDEMGKKTAFRRLSKWIELSPEFRDALEADADRIEEMRFDNALPIKRASIRLQAPSGSGSETTSGEPGVEVSTGEAEPTGSPNGEPSAAPPKRKQLKKKPEPEPPKVGENESQMLMRLAGIDRQKFQLVQVAKEFEALKDNQNWDDIGEEGFAVMLDPANWKLIEAELKTLS